MGGGGRGAEGRNMELGMSGWVDSLINSVEGSVAGVQLDGGEDSLSGGGSRHSVVGEGGSSGGKTGIGVGSGETGIGVGSGETGIGEGGVKTGIRECGVKTGIGEGGVKTGIGVGEGGGDHLGLTALPLGAGGSVAGDGFIESGLEFSLGGNNFGGVGNRGGAGQGEDGSVKRSNNGGSGSGGEVGTSHTETVDGVSNVVDCLQDTVGVHILVGALGNSESVARLSSGRWATSITESKLSKLVLSMELVRLLERSKGPGAWSGQQLSAGSTHASCQYNQSVHFQFLAAPF
jgi:hypothetical protein